MTLSAVIPFYNLEGYVRQCLDSVAAATSRLPEGRVVIDVVCVDDGSSDGTAAALDAYAAADSRFRVVHKPNGGEGSARNAGIDAAVGDWVTFLDGDDVWLENYLEVAVPLIEANPGADVVSLKYADFADGAEPPQPSSAEPRVLDLRRSVPSDVLLETGVFPTFFRRGFLGEARFSALPLGADRLFVAQLLARAETLVKCDAVVHGYRIRSGSMARAPWLARKVESQCDFAFGALTALAESGKTLGREGLSYLASLWLSDVPARIARIKGQGRREAWEHWRATLGSRCAAASRRFDFVRRLLGACSFSMPLSLAVARLFRKVGVS